MRMPRMQTSCEIAQARGRAATTKVKRYVPKPSQVLHGDRFFESSTPIKAIEFFAHRRSTGSAMLGRRVSNVVVVEATFGNAARAGCSP
jgi:hypothetical protein